MGCSWEGNNNVDIKIAKLKRKQCFNIKIAKQRKYQINIKHKTNIGIDFNSNMSININGKSISQKENLVINKNTQGVIECFLKNTYFPTLLSRPWCTAVCCWYLTACKKKFDRSWWDCENVRVVLKYLWYCNIAIVFVNHMVHHCFIGSFHCILCTSLIPSFRTAGAVAVVTV